MSRRPRASSLVLAQSDIEENKTMYSDSSYSAAAVAVAQEHPQWCPQNVTQASETRTRLMVVSPFDDDLVSLLEILSHTSGLSQSNYYYEQIVSSMCPLLPSHSSYPSNSERI
jgi:hypothetical protein